MVAAILLLLALAAASGSARAELTLMPDSFAAAPLDAGGQPDLRAGVHPDRLLVRFAFRPHDDGTADGNPRDVVIDLPPGYSGDPTAVPACARGTFLQNGCDPAAQVGTLGVVVAGASSPIVIPLYNIAPREDEVAEFGGTVLVLPVRLTVRLREESDDGIEIRLLDLPQSIPLTGAEVELWGVPADHQSGTNIARKPLLTAPTACDESAPTVLRVRPWEQPDRWLTASAAPSGPLTGCDQLAFAPILNAALDTPAADTPSGLAIDVALPQNDDPDGRATSQAAALTATLPGGLTLSPGVAAGLGACDDADFGLGTANPAHCPDASKLGTVELSTSALREPLSGAIYLGRPLLSDRFRLFVAAAGSGAEIKLAGSLRPDPATGRVALAFDSLPPLPVSRLRLHFKDGPRAPLATPPSCGPAAVTVSIVPRRGGAPVRRAAVLEVNAGPNGTACAGTPPFAPGFVAGSASDVAGRDAPFAVTVTRADGEQALDRFAVTLPPGVSARLASVTRCPTSLAVQAACPADSRVGDVAVEAGAGAHPLALAGDVFLTGPHAGAPFGLALTLDGRRGPLDLGTLVVLAALQLDPADARVTVVTDPLPQLLGGIPLRLRTLALDVDRRGFMRNATSCAPERASAVFRSLDAASAQAAVRYALGGCARLRFAPSLALRLGPRRALRRGGRPRVTIALRARPGDAALRTAAVELPRALALDPPLGLTVCTQLRARDGRCPAASAVGTARLRTPLLPHALVGDVSLVEPRSGVQPELWTTVRGMGVRFELRATTSVRRDGRVATRFVDLPDVPLSSLRLTLAGGSGGLLRLAGGDLCAPAARSRTAVHATLVGHNGGTRALRLAAAPAC